MQDIKIPYGWDVEKKKLFKASDPEIQKGLACNCTCPECGGKLIARKGEKNRAHFSHYDEDVHCGGGLETTLHLLVKQIIEETKHLKVGTIDLNFDSVVTEEKTDAYTPDVKAWCNGIEYWIEVANTHFCEENKIAYIKENKINAVELDVSKFRYDEKMNEIVLPEEGKRPVTVREYLGGENEGKYKWIFNEEFFRQKDKELAEKINKKQADFAKYVFENRISIGKFEEEAWFEQQDLDWEYEKLNCDKENLPEFTKAAEEYKAWMNYEIERRSDIINNIPICPLCGSQMQKRTGTYGTFWGCTDYPNCKAIMHYDRDWYKRCLNEPGYWERLAKAAIKKEEQRKTKENINEETIHSEGHQHHNKGLSSQDEELEKLEKRWVQEEEQIPPLVVNTIDACINCVCEDNEGNRWYKCERCGRIGRSDLFITYQYASGLCKYCELKSRTEKDSLERRKSLLKAIEKHREAVKKKSVN